MNSFEDAEAERNEGLTSHKGTIAIRSAHQSTICLCSFGEDVSLDENDTGNFEYFKGHSQMYSHGTPTSSLASCRNTLISNLRDYPRVGFK